MAFILENFTRKTVIIDWIDRREEYLLQVDLQSWKDFSRCNDNLLRPAYLQQAQRTQNTLWDPKQRWMIHYIAPQKISILKSVLYLYIIRSTDTLSFFAGSSSQGFQRKFRNVSKVRLGLRLFLIHIVAIGKLNHFAANLLYHLFCLLYVYAGFHNVRLTEILKILIEFLHGSLRTHYLRQNYLIFWRLVSFVLLYNVGFVSEV